LSQSTIYTTLDWSQNQIKLAYFCPFDQLLVPLKIKNVFICRF
jgi:hypothetical protein